MPLLPLVGALLLAVSAPAAAGSGAPSAAAQAFARGDSVDAAAPGRAPELDLARQVQDARPPVDAKEFEGLVRGAARALGLDAATADAAVKLYAARLKTLPPATPQQSARLRAALDAQNRAAAATASAAARQAAASRRAQDTARALAGGRVDAGVVAGGGASAVAPGTAAARAAAARNMPAAQAPKLARAAAPPPPATGPAPKPDYVDASHRLINHYGDPSLALSVVITARGGDDDSVPQASRAAAKNELAKVLSVPSAAVDDELLARMDHFLNTYGGVRYAALDPQTDDGWLMRKTRTAGRVVFGTVALGVALGYEGVKLVDQKTGSRFGVWIPKALGQQGYDFNHHSSQASWGGVGAKATGAFYGVFDEEPNAPARR